MGQGVSENRETKRRGESIIHENLGCELRANPGIHTRQLRQISDQETARFSESEKRGKETVLRPATISSQVSTPRYSDFE